MASTCESLIDSMPAAFTLTEAVLSGSWPKGAFASVSRSTEAPTIPGMERMISASSSPRALR